MRKKAHRSLAALESLLEASLKPVTPRQEFVQDLRARLVSGIEHKVLGMPLRTFQNVLLAVGAVASGGILLFTGLRAVISLLGAIGLVRRYNQQAAERRGTS